uniref:SEC7 domain-containing protein n=1 Tax=Globodera rostochiensis TaxID=31243 RepID=A0A914HS48_GLORO
MTEGTEMFNRHSPQKGVEFLSEKGLLKNPLDPQDVACWLRQNPRLDKSKIAEYICNRKRPEVLSAFVKSLEFGGLRLDLALRIFSKHWFNANNQPFEHVDAAYTLAYAILMLNTDHAQSARLMPAEQVGLLRENYLWRVLQRRSETPEGQYWAVPEAGWNDKDLFCVIWGPLTAALHYVINKSEDETVLAVAFDGLN